MNLKTVSRSVLTLVLVALVSSFAFDAPAKKYSPVGNWEYSAPDVEEGYQAGNMIITKNGQDYKVTLAMNEYVKMDAENVVYKNKALSFSIWVENQEILVSGNFDGDTFKGTTSYFGEDFSFNAIRKAAE